MSCVNKTNSCVYERPNHFVALNSLRKQDALCDVTIKVGNKKIRAHKIILAATISYFREIFMANLQGRNRDVIFIKNVSEQNMQAIITFSYTGKIVFTEENAVALLKDAVFFKLPDVKYKCMEYLQSNIKTNNVCEMVYLGMSQPEYNSLLEHSKTFIRENLQNVSLTADFSSLDFELFKNILMSVDTSKVSSEIKLEAVIRWGSDNFERKKTLLELLRCINPSELKVDSLTHYLFKDEFKNSFGCKHSEFVAEVLSMFNKLGKDNISKKSKSFIYIHAYEPSAEAFSQSEIYDFVTEKWSVSTFVRGSIDPDDFGKVLVHEDKLYTIPHIDPRCIHVCNVNDKVWSKAAITIPFDISGAQLAILNDYLYACGGLCKPIGKRDVWRFSFKTRTWQRVSDMIKPRSSFSLVVLQGFLYAIGGEDTHKPIEFTMTMERYDPQINKWTFVSDLNVTAISYFNYAAVGLNDKIYISGGMLDGDIVPLFEEYDLITKKWTKRANMKNARDNHALVEYDGKIWAIGGWYFANELSSVEVYDPIKRKWSYGKPMNRVKGPVEGCVFSSNS